MYVYVTHALGVAMSRAFSTGRALIQSCWTRRQKNSTISSTSFSSSRKPSTSSSMSFNSPRKGPPRPRTRSSSPRHPLAENEYLIAGHWIAGQNTEHRTLVLWRWRRWLQALGLFYKKNMPNNNTAYSICKINLSFISFLWVEQWSRCRQHTCTCFQHNWYTEVLQPHCCQILRFDMNHKKGSSMPRPCPRSMPRFIDP